MVSLPWPQGSAASFSVKIQLTQVLYLHVLPPPAVLEIFKGPCQVFFRG